MARKDKQGNWLDDKNYPVPPKHILARDKKRDAMVERLIKRALKIEKDLSEFRTEAWDAVEAYLQELAEEKQIRSDWRGNIILPSFDNRMRVFRNSDAVIDFNERITLVQELLRQWVAERSESSDKDVLNIVQRLLSTDELSRINKSRYIQLLNYQISGDTWKRAMECLREAFFIKHSRVSLSFALKEDGVDEKWRGIILDFSAVKKTEER